jgi:hypothetical protein
LPPLARLLLFSLTRSPAWSDAIGVGAVAAEHRVGAGATVQKIRPGAAVELLLAVLPVRLSLKPLPIRFSMLISVSEAGTAGGLRPGTARLTVTPLVPAKA